MIAILEGLVAGFVVLSLAYVLVSIYSRSLQRESLEKEFDTTFPPGSGDVTADRDAYVSEGMTAYQHGLRRRLIGLIYVLPAVAFVAEGKLPRVQDFGEDFQ